MTSQQIRQQFLDFFASKGHALVESSPVVPLDDPTLMFTNAGMNQFKDVFLGTGSRSYKRAANTQKCIRAGGKHNDLDDVGQDTYHHTFFEMLGNWSFGDYFKKEAIQWAWELLTGVWGIEKDRLHATYFEGDKVEGLEPDTEAARLWESVTDINPNNIHPGNKKDNFWEMGETGPCGPCSEIHIDLTPDKSGAELVNAGDARVIELWNLVFIQFNRSSDGTLTPLPHKHVDTGMGFERLVAVLQGMNEGRIGAVSNYDTDVFAPIFEAIQKRTAAPRYTGTLPNDKPRRDREEADVGKGDPRRDREGAGNERHEGTTVRRHERSASANRQSTIDNRQLMIDVSYRVIADHVRCLTFAVTDGAIPSNEGRGYVLRRILRRAVRYGRQYFDMHEPFLCDLVQPLVEHMAGAFPELRTAHGGKNIAHVTETIRDEEESFGRTYDRGIKLFNKEADSARRYHHGKISGEAAFKLHDTYGFTIDLTEQMAEEQGLAIDMAGYERSMDEARKLACTGALVTTDELLDSITLNHVDDSQRLRVVQTDDTAKYEYHPRCTAEVVYIAKFGGPEIRPGEDVVVVTDRTCFYVEQGGQVADTGTLTTPTGKVLIQHVKRIERGIILHKGVVTEGTIDREQIATLVVDVQQRLPTMQNHTSTHLLNWALREVLCSPEERENPHVQQKGSLVDPEKTRFDFSHNKPLTDGELERVESLVNERIVADLSVYTKEVDQQKARQINTLRAVFGEKYPEVVRVVSIGADIDAMLSDPKNPKWMNYSVEFCGGTHLKKSSEAERFVLVAEEGVAKGIRRVVGISGKAAKQAVAQGQELLAEVEALVHGSSPTAPSDGLPDEGDGVSDGPRRDREGAGNQNRDTRGAYGPRSGSCPSGSDPSGSDPSRRLQPARMHDDLTTALAAFQAKLTDATIPILVRRQIQERLTELQRKAKEQQKQAAAVSGKAVMDRVASLLKSAEVLGGVTVVVGQVPSADANALRSAIDRVRNKTEASAVLLATFSDEKVTLVAGMSKSVVAKGIKAGDLIKEIAPLVGGQGGGRPDMAQGGGTKPDAITTALKKAKAWIEEKLA